MHPQLAETYRQFAEIEARGVSEVYADLTSSIADDESVLDLIAALPRLKRQPNLVFILARSTQTNEAARCAVLLPVLSRLDGPLALIEVGASAGLCLYPDRYSYRYDVDGALVELDPPDGPSDVQLPCAIDAASVPARLPEVAFRVGVDLNPLDVSDPDELDWLETLIWPGHDERRRRLRDAASLVAHEPPQIVRGDLLDEIPRLIDEAPRDAQVVVFHSAVLAYLEPDRRERFAALMRSRPDVVWISNEGAGVFPDIARRVSVPSEGRFVLSVNGDPVALTGPHGQTHRAL